MAQAIHVQAVTPSTIRGQQPAPTLTQYLVVIGCPTGDYILESSLSELCLDCTVSDIAGGQHEHVRRVIAVDLNTGRSWDASKEVARGVLDQCIDCDGEVPDYCREFLEDVLGVNFVQSCLVEAAA